MDNTTGMDPLAQPTPAGTQPAQAQPVQPTQPLADAPDSMMQQAPSAFDPATAPQQKKRRSLFLPCCCVFLLLIVLTVGGLFGVAYFTDVEIPFFSDLAGRLEEMLDGELTAEKVQEEVASSVFSAMIPLVNNSQGLIANYANVTVTEDYLQSFINDQENIQSFRFELDADTQSSDQSESSILSNLELQMVGAVNMKDSANETFESTYDVGLTSGGIGFDVDGEVKMIGTTTYLKVDNYPQLLLGLGNMSIDDSWYFLEEDELSDTTSSLGEGELLNEEEPQDLTEDSLKSLNDFLTDDAIVKNFEILPEEDIKGNQSQCVRMSWNQEELVEVMKRYAEIYGEEFNQSEAEEAVKEIEKLLLEICIGKETNNIHRVLVDLDGVDTSENAADLRLNVILWDYNSDIAIVAPEDAKPFDQMLNTSELGLGDIDITIPEDSL